MSLQTEHRNSGSCECLVLITFGHKILFLSKKKTKQTTLQFENFLAFYETAIGLFASHLYTWYVFTNDMYFAPIVKKNNLMA